MTESRKFQLTEEESATCITDCTTATYLNNGAIFDFVKGQKLKEHDSATGKVLAQLIWLPKVEEILKNENLKIKFPFRPSKGNVSPEEKQFYGYVTCKKHGELGGSPARIWCMLEDFVPGRTIDFNVSDWVCSGCEYNSSDNQEDMNEIDENNNECCINSYKESPVGSDTDQLARSTKNVIENLEANLVFFVKTEMVKVSTLPITEIKETIIQFAEKMRNEIVSQTESLVLPETFVESEVFLATNVENVLVSDTSEPIEMLTIPQTLEREQLTTDASYLYKLNLSESDDSIDNSFNNNSNENTNNDMPVLFH